MGAISLGVAAIVWLLVVGRFFSVDTQAVWDHEQVSELGRELADRQFMVWTDTVSRALQAERMRESNDERDFMSRSYVAWSLANLALRDPSTKERALHVIDAILAETLQVEDDYGFHWFLADAAGTTAFEDSPPASLFVDGQITMMMGLRRLVEEDRSYREPMARRVSRMVGAMEQSPMLAAESYPNACLTLDIVNALAAVRLSDVLSGEDHGGLFARWVEVARSQLVDAETGLLVSAYDLSGEVIDGPRGSSIWPVAHALQLVDTAFARSQYLRAANELEVSFLGFGLARDQPSSPRTGRIRDGSPGAGPSGSRGASSSLALVAASGFGDERLLGALLRTVEFRSFPIRDESGLSYTAGTPLDEALVLYALTAGPAWAEIARRAGAG